MSALRSEFLLDPSVIFLNHGSFGATPRPVFERYQELQRDLERQPVAFIQRQLPGLLKEARDALGEYLNISGDDLFFVPNPTFAVNLLARSMDLRPGDEVLTTDLEYGACDNCWDFIASKSGANIVRQQVNLPVASKEELVEQIWSGVTPKTRILFLSHITSTTALRLPVEELIVRTRKAGILTIVDGAHAPSQIDLDLAALGPDFYVGACHKWLCSPKGASFLYVSPDRQAMIEPLVVGWGYGPTPKPDFGSTFLNYGSWLGTKDMSAYLAVPSAIDFQTSHNWKTVRNNCTQKLCDVLPRLAAVAGTPCIYPDLASWVSQMGVVEIPNTFDGVGLKTSLLNHHRIEIPVMVNKERQFLRVSVQGYVSDDDLNSLVAALEVELPKNSR